MKSGQSEGSSAKGIFQGRIPFFNSERIEYAVSEENRFSSAVLSQNIRRVMRWLKGASFVFADRGFFDFLNRSEKYDSRLNAVLVSFEKDSEHITKSKNYRAITVDLCLRIAELDGLLVREAEQILDLVYLLNPHDEASVRDVFEKMEKSVSEIETEINKRHEILSAH